MKEHEQWEAYIDGENTCCVHKVTEMCGLPEDHYDYEEPMFLPANSIRVIVQDPTNDTWRESLKRHLEAEHPQLCGYQLLKVPRDPWDGRRLVFDSIAILKENLEVRPGGIPEVGNVIDRTFQVERPLGSGTAGTAFEVKLTRDWAGHPMGSRFCLKWYNDDIFEREHESTALARRVREATVGGSLNHPNLVRVYSTSNLWIAGRPRYLLMDIISGETLERLNERGAVSSDRVRQLVLDIANALKALHEASILHRDVKAANVMVSASGEAVLLDLGVIRPLSESTMTASQGFLGTTRFAAPEWLFAEECTAASDIYSLGTIVYQLLTGREVFSHIRNRARLVEAVRSESILMDQVGLDDRRQSLAELTVRMLAKAPHERPCLGEVIETITNC